MASPTRFLSGISTFPQKSIVNTFPTVPSQYQVNKGDDFIPFRQSTDYTATTGGTGATAAAFGWNAGAMKITCGSTTPFKSFEALGANSLQVIPGNQLWHDVRMTAPTGSQTNPSNDATIYTGFFDNVDPTAASNGVYFVKPSGGTAVHFVIKKAGTVTTFQNVADLANPSGFYGSTFATPGSVTVNTTGTTLSSIALNSVGGGYRVAPLAVVNGTAGSGAQVYVQVNALPSGQPGNGPVSGYQLYAPYITNAGSGYTAGTLSVDLMPWLNFQFYYNGKGTMYVGVNGFTVLTLGKDGVTVATPGSTYDTSTVGNSFNFSGTTLSTSIAPVQPYPGDVYVASPQVPLQLAFGLVGTTANNRVVYVEEINIGTELN